MSTPYRDCPPAEDNEAIPDFGDRRLWPGLLRRSVLLLTASLVLAAYDVTEAIKLLIIWGPGLVVLAIITVLQAPVGAWLASRHERSVVEGVAALEAKVSAGE